MIRRTITAKYTGRCRECGATVTAGAQVVFIRAGERGGRGSIYHIPCAPAGAPKQQDGTAEEFIPTSTSTPPPQAKVCTHPDCDLEIWHPDARYCASHVCILGACQRLATGDGLCASHQPKPEPDDTRPFDVPDDGTDVRDADAPSPVPVPAPPSSSFLDMMAGELIPFLRKHGFEPAPTVDPKRAEEEQVREILIVKRDVDLPDIRIDTPHPLFELLLKLTSVRQHVYLWGAPGGGKSHAAHAAATALGLTYRYVSLSPQSMPSLLTGYMDAHGRYVRTAFRECYEHGGIFCIDEVDNCNGALLASLNSALANGMAEFPDAQIPRHPDCVIVATGNTPGMGGTLSFPERRALDLAFRDRFAFVEWIYAPKWEKAVVRTMHPSADAAETWCGWVLAVRKWCAKEYPALCCSPRASFKGAALLGMFDLEQIAEMVLFQGIDPAVKSKVLDSIPLPAIHIRNAKAA